MLAGAYETDAFLLPQTSGRQADPDAWARIRTWEPLREGILSPSPLTRLGYPRVGPRRGRATLNLSRAARLPQRARRFFGGVFFRLEGTVHGPILHEVVL